MSRDEGFRNADIDVGIIDDPKMRALVRRCGDAGLAGQAFTAYVSTVLSSWERGERIALEDAAPLWIPNLDAIAEHLVAVELLNEKHQLPERSWANWFLPARSRLEDTRERWRRAARNRRGPRDDSAMTPDGIHDESSTPVLSVLPDKSSPSSPSSPSRNGHAQARGQHIGSDRV